MQKRGLSEGIKTMASQISLVEITVIEYETGNEEDFAYLEDEIELSFPNWRESVSALDVSYGRLDTIFTKNCYCFQFRIIGQSNDRNYSGGLEWIMQELDTEDIFGDWMDNFIQMFNDVMNEYYRAGVEIYDNAAKFVTAWEYSSYKDYYGEYDDEWQLLGRVNMDKIKDILY